jgi:hypothetical protein
MRAGRLDELAMHPTVKPVAMVADAIKDCSKRGSLVLDPFCGSGTILIVAEKTGRRARAIELDPKYVDVAIRRWQQYSGKIARLAPMGETFDEISEARLGEVAAWGFSAAVRARRALFGVRGPAFGPADHINIEA